MRKIMIISAMILSGICMDAYENKDSLLVMFWNLENFFDYTDRGEGDSDHDFSSYGNRHWTKKRFYAKCNLISKSIFWISDKYGRIPDIIGLAEIENSNVLYRLLRDTALKKTDYTFIHYDSRDRRGIDVALLYRKSIMRPSSITRKVPVHNGDTLQTRDILHVRMKVSSSASGNETIDFIVNHHPSKFGGEKSSMGKRRSAMECMLDLCDSLNSSYIISMGDFNDTQDSDVFRMITGKLVNKSSCIKGKGTIRYQGRWDMIDMFLVSPEINDMTSMEILEIPFLMVRDNVHPGIKPLRTYSGPRYLGGASDHCPILLWIFEPNY